MSSDSAEVWPFKGACERFAFEHGVSHVESRVIQSMTLDFFRLSRALFGSESRQSYAFFIGGTWVLDHFWHTLILDTRHYARFCEVFFGSFMHHTPRLSEGDSDAEPTEDEIRSQVRLGTRVIGAAKTRALFRGLTEVYGTVPRKSVTPVDATCGLLSHPLTAPYLHNETEPVGLSEVGRPVLSV